MIGLEGFVLSLVPKSEDVRALDSEGTRGTRFLVSFRPKIGATRRQRQRTGRRVSALKSANMQQ
jgi:hypothetical protein